MDVRAREGRPSPVDRVHIEPPVTAHLRATRDHADPPGTARIERLDRGELHVLGAAEDELGGLDLVERRVADVQVDRVRVAIIREEGEIRDAGEARVPEVRRLNRVDPEAGTEERIANEGGAAAEQGDVRIDRRIGNRDAGCGPFLAEHSRGALRRQRERAPSAGDEGAAVRDVEGERIVAPDPGVDQGQLTARKDLHVRPRVAGRPLVDVQAAVRDRDGSGDLEAAGDRDGTDDLPVERPGRHTGRADLEAAEGHRDPLGVVRGADRRIRVVELVARGARGRVRHLLVVVPERFRVGKAGRRDLVREQRDEREAIRVRPVPGVRPARGPAEVPKGA